MTSTPCTVDGCPNPMRYNGLGLCQTHYHRRYRTGDINPDRPIKKGNPRGETATYLAAHTRIVHDRGPAKSHLCARCGNTPAKDWAYLHNSPDQLWGTDGHGTQLAYSLNPDDYQPMCGSCHATYDQLGTTRTRNSAGQFTAST